MSNYQVGFQDEIKFRQRVVKQELHKFKNDMYTHAYAGRIREDFLSGIHSGVNGTPTFYINGIRYNDSWDLETLLERLRSAI